MLHSEISFAVHAICYLCLAWIPSPIDCPHIHNHLRLALASILNAKHGAAAILIAIVCSSWTIVNMGTSGRHISHPLGADEGRPAYVDAANMMTSRCLGELLENCHPFPKLSFSWR